MREIDPLPPAESTEQDEDDFFLMANISPQSSGLPFVVWISEGGYGKHDVRQHDVRVKVAKGPKDLPDVAVTLRPELRIVKGSMDASDFSLLKSWIERNQQMLIDYWDSEISTDVALDRLVKI